MKEEIRSISGVQCSQAFIWLSADINLCAQATKAETYHNLPSGGLCSGGNGEEVKGSSSFAQQPRWLWAWCVDLWGCAPGEGKPVSPRGAVSLVSN